MTYDTQRTGTATMTAPTSAGMGLTRLNEIEGRDIIGLNDEHIGTVNDVLIAVVAPVCLLFLNRVLRPVTE